MTTRRIAAGLLLWALLSLPALSLRPASAARPAEAPLPPPAHRVLTRAYRLLEKGDAAGAVKALEAFRAGRPAWLQRGRRDPSGYFHYMIDFTLANAYLSMGKADRAITAYRHVLAARPDFFPAWANLAKACYESRRFKEAAQAFEKAFETSDPSDPILLYYAAVSQVSAGDNRSALLLLERLLALRPQEFRTEWRELLVHVLFNLKRRRRALPHIEILAATTRGDRRKRWQEICLDQYILLGRRRKALAFAQQLVRQDPVYPLWWKMLARLDMQRRRYTAALADLMLSDFITSAEPADLRLAADLSMNLEVPVLAVRFYRRAWERHKDARTLEGLVLAWQRRHRPEKALAVLESGLRFCASADLDLLRARLLIALGRYRQARDALEALNRKSPGNGRTWLLLGYTQWGLADLAAARRAFRRAADFREQRKTALEMLRRLRPEPASAPDRTQSRKNS